MLAILYCCRSVPLLKEMFVLVRLEIAFVPQRLLLKLKATLTVPPSFVFKRDTDSMQVRLQIIDNDRGSH